jgi:hypothetical protein
MQEHALVGGWEVAVETMAPPEPLAEAAAPRAEMIPTPFPLPILLQASGLYQLRHGIRLSTPIPFQPIPIRPVSPAAAATPGADFDAEEALAALDEAAALPLIPLSLLSEDLRLDVDGGIPLMTASGTQYFRLTERLHWIARLARLSNNTFVGRIWYRDGATSTFPYTLVRINVTRSLFPNQRRARVTFSGGGAPARTVIMPYVSAFLRPVDLEYDCVEGTTATLSVPTHAHSNRPATLPAETLTIDTVFRRSGFRVTRGTDDVVPISLAGADEQWSNAEMHDAMQAYWSRFANKAQWALWHLFASLHEWGTSLGGIMFDDIGPNHRQGCATFVDSFIKDAPANDPAPAAWVRRMIFWTAVHEMGHCFNLAHSWQKSLGEPWGKPWIPLADEPEARSFMNYPFRVTGGQAAFFADFHYRFSDAELLFMRHAPARFVRMGDADWFDHHGFEQAAVSAEPAVALDLRVNRPTPVFDFLEPVMVELKLKNISTEPQLVDEQVLAAADHFTIVVKKRGRPARTFSPFAHYCFKSKPRVLEPGQALYDSLFVAAGTGGWLIDEPGDYLVQAALHRDGEDVVSRPLKLRVRPPREYLEEQLAQDVLTEDPARVLAFDGSRVMDRANAALVELVERLPEHRAAIHARVALAEPLTRGHKVLELDPANPEVLSNAEAAGGAVRALGPDPDQAADMLQSALVAAPDVAAETLGHVDYNEYASHLSRWLEEQGDRDMAGQVVEELLLTLAGRGVIEPVLSPIRERAAKLGSKRGGQGRKGKKDGRGKPSDSD